MARGCRFSPVGGVGDLGIRRTSFPFLPARFMAIWRGARLSIAVENGPGHLHLACPLTFRLRNVAFGTRITLPIASDRSSSHLRCESVPARRGVLPQRLRRTSRNLILPFSGF